MRSAPKRQIFQQSRSWASWGFSGSSMEVVYTGGGSPPRREPILERVASTLAIRSLERSDLARAGELRSAAGWNQTLPDWERLLSLEPEGCFAAHLEDRLVGTATTTRYGPHLAWIGMVLVHPGFRRRGIARALVKECLRWLEERGVRSIKLDASPEGKPLYRELGFREEWSYARWEGPALHRPLLREPAQGGEGPRPLRPEDWEPLLALDRVAFGAARGQLLAEIRKQSYTVEVEPGRGELRGYGMVRPGARADFLGPLVSRSVQEARSLASVLLGSGEAETFFWDIPDRNPEAVALAQALGFQRARPLTRMVLGDDAPAGDISLSYGLADPATG
jgi:GNAT superfamily N-acetyltransferase